MKDYGNKLIILGIGPLTPLAKALEEDKENLLSKIGGLYLQGTVDIVNDNIEPSMKSYNFSED